MCVALHHLRNQGVEGKNNWLDAAKFRLSNSILQLAAFPNTGQGKQVRPALKHREILYLPYFLCVLILKGRIKSSFNNPWCLLSWL